MSHSSNVKRDSFRRWRLFSGLPVEQLSTSITWLLVPKQPTYEVRANECGSAGHENATLGISVSKNPYGLSTVSPQPTSSWKTQDLVDT